MSLVEYKAPRRKITRDVKKSVFLAGAIDMGRAIHWQAEVVEKLKAANLNIDVFNPRRDDWDESWKQTIHNAQFKEQVEWELEHLTKSVVFFFFPKDSQSPISLLELGLVVGGNKRVVVCCENGFYRRGNIEVLCNLYGIPLYEDLNLAIGALVQRYLR